MGRRLLVIVFAVLAFPATAAAQSLDEMDCRDQTGLRASCVGLAKLGERVSAECRRTGLLTDADCWSRVGRQVIREEVDAYEQSWTHRTLAFQQRLGDTVAFRDAPWVGTHNSYNTTDEPPTLSGTDSNQQLSLTDQLRLDVRSLEIDAHYVNGQVVACHGQGDLGCTNERPLAERLAEVATWLDGNPGEVLLLYLEDGIDEEAGYAPAAKVVTDAFGDRIYRPRGTGCTQLPLELTREAVRAAGAQVVIVSDCGQGAWTGIVHSWPPAVRYEDRPNDYGGFPRCGGVSRDTYATKLVRFYEDSTFVSAAAEPTGQSSTDDGLTPETVRAMMRCGVDLTGFDQLLPRDGRLDAHVWSWADGQPSGAGTCTIQNADGRWEARSCAERHAAACKNADGTWTITPKAERHATAAKRCPLGTPRTGYDNGELRALAGDRTVWLGLTS